LCGKTSVWNVYLKGVLGVEMVFTDLISIPGVPSHLNYQAGYTKGYTTGFKVRTEAGARAVALSPCAI
jgi:hypothetical protein